MKTNNRGLPIIINALVWAALILMTTRFTVDANHRQNVVFWLIAGWFTVNFLLRNKGRSECACLLRRFSWTDKR